MRAVFCLLGVASATLSYCNDAYERFGIDQNDCEAIHQEYMAMVTSGKTLDVIAQELKEDEDFENQGDDEMNADPSGDLSAPHDTSYAKDADMSCSMSCASGTNACNICNGVISQNTCCRRRKNSTRKSITYGGYVKSHVLIQCYGMIDEGCRRLPTWHSGCYKVCGGCSDSCTSASCGCATTCQATNSACGCATSAANFQRYLHCVGRRVSRCYRTKIIHTRQVCHAAPTTWGGCTYKWCVPCSQCGTSTSCQSTCSNSCTNTGMPHLV